MRLSFRLRSQASRKRAVALAGLPLAAVLVLVAFVARPALAAEQLAAPTQLQVVHIADRSADLWWSYDPNHLEDVVQRRVNNAWQEYGRSAGGALALTNLTPGTTYTFRVYSVASPYTGHTNSAPSAPITFTTLAAPDSVPPSTPPTPIFSSITTTSVNVYWGESTDNVQVTGYYLQQLIGGVWTTIRTVGPGERFQTVYGLSPNTTYQFAAIAFDARGNQSPRAVPGSVTTLASTATATCRVQTILFFNGYSVWITVINTTPVPLTGWTIQFQLPAHITASPVNGTITRTATGGTFIPAVWYTTIGPGGQATVGLQGGGTPFVPPTGFTLGGTPCTTV
jgi:hypothetical protein